MNINAIGVERAIRSEGSVNVFIENCKITTNGVGIHVKGSNKVEINNCSITVDVKNNSKYSAHLRTGVIVGGANANVDITGSTINAINNQKEQKPVSPEDSSWTWSWSKGLYVGTTGLDAKLTVNDTVVNADFSILIDGTSDTNKPGTIEINSGKYAGLVGTTGYSYKTIIINGGLFSGLDDFNDFYGKDNPIAKLVISGGTFNIEPDAKFITDGYEAKQNDGKFDVIFTGNTGNASYTLSEFNALTEIPEGIKNVYLNIGAVSLQNGDVTIGNEDICDVWSWDRDTNHSVGDILEDGRKVYMVRDNDTIYSSNKAGITLYISGSVNDNPEGGLNQSNSHAITFKIPDASNVVFTKDFTVNGYFRMFTGWSDGRNLGGAFYNRTVKSVLFDHSTFNGIWIQNGGFFADSLTLDGCTFNAYQNKVSANDSNPLWFCNIRDCDITVQNCTFKASRPIKVVEQGVYGAEVKILNNTFDMSLANTANDASKPKNDAIMFSTTTDDSTLGNVVVSGNTVTGATSLLTFFNPSRIMMADGTTFTVSGNTMNGAETSVEWKTATEYTPNFVIEN